MVSPWRGLPSNRLRVERVVTELPECARPSSYGGLGLLEPCVLSCVLSAGRIPLRFHHVYRTHATHSVMPVYTRSTFGTDGLAQPIGRGPHGFLWFLPRVPVNQIRPIFSNSDRNLAAHGDSGLALVYVRGHGTRTSHNHRYGPDLAVTSHGWLLPRATACCTMILPPSKAGNRTTARGRVTSAPPAP